MKISYSLSAVFAALLLAGCTSTHQASLTQAQENFEQYQQITQQYQIDEAWWTGYRDKNLNRLVELALENNVDLAKSAIAVNRALYSANLLGADLIPAFSGSASSSASKGVGSSSNVTSTGTSTIGHQLGLNLSYTLDLWQRLADSASAAEWEHKATEEDLRKVRQTIINSVVNSYFQLAYLQDAIKVSEKNIKSYQQIQRILNNKFQAGLIDRLSVDQAEQAIISEKNNLLNLQTSQKTAEQTLRNLLNLAPNAPLDLRYTSILNTKLQGVDTNVPVSVIANRPDVIASLHRLQSAFKSLNAMEKSWYPSVTLGASLSGRAASMADVTDNPVGNGVLSFNLPFLDWARVSNNIKISESSYEATKLSYQQTVNSALNEVDRYYFAYQQSKRSLANLQKKYDTDKRVSRYYQNRYEQGVSEFREWINALSTERNSELSLLNAKFNILQNETAVYQAMAGKFKP